MEARAFSPILKKLIPVVLTIIIVAWLYKFYGAWAYTIKNLAEFFRLTWEHLVLVIISMAAAVIVPNPTPTITAYRSCPGHGD